METEQTEKYKCWKCENEFNNTDNLNLDYEKNADSEDTYWICSQCLHNQFKEENTLIKEIHNSEENALIVENYPYGFKRTQIRYWIETTKNGDRFCSQTLNPKTDKWNKPKKSTYCAVMVLIKKNENGHISYTGLSFSTDKTAIINFLDFIKDYNLNEQQEKQIRIIKAYSKAYENVTWEIRPQDPNEDELTKMCKEKEQKEVKENINKMVGYYYNTGEF